MQVFLFLLFSERVGGQVNINDINAEFTVALC